MQRRDFLKTSAALVPGTLAARAFAAHEHQHKTGADALGGPIYGSPREAMQAERERLLYATALCVGTGRQQPDYLATVDVDPDSGTYSQVVHRLAMPKIGDELHHFGWNLCGSCHGHGARARRYLIVPGLKSSRIHVIDVADATHPKMHKVIEPRAIIQKTNLTAPHTVHCLPDGRIMISMLGDGQGNGPGGFLLLDEKFDVAGRWEKDAGGMQFNYDFWYQPRHDVMISSEWAAPKTFAGGFDPKDVEAGKYGRRLHFWNWSDATLARSIDLGESGMIPLEVRFHHDPDSPHGFVGAALSSTMWHWFRDGGDWKAEKVISVEPVETEGWPFPVPGLITDLVLSLDDRWLYFSNWLHGDLRQYDVSDPSRPKLTGHVWLGGVIGREPDAAVADRKLTGGPQMVQLSLDGKRLYVTNSLYSSWDNQFYPKIAEQGSWLMQIECDTENGGLKVNDRFFVDFGQEPGGPARAHEMRFPGGDCTSDIWI